MSDFKLEILPSGHIKFKRGNKAYNAKMRGVISDLVDGDEEIMSKVDKFLSGSEEVELLFGDTILCG